MSNGVVACVAAATAVAIPDSMSGRGSSGGGGLGLGVGGGQSPTRAILCKPLTLGKWRAAPHTLT